MIVMMMAITPSLNASSLDLVIADLSPGGVQGPDAPRLKGSYYLRQLGKREHGAERQRKANGTQDPDR